MNQESTSQSWQLRKPDGATFGPVSVEVLQKWARDGRVAPEDEVSGDGKTWIPARNLPALEMRWEVLLADGGRYGPLNIFAIGGLLLEGLVTCEDRVQEAGVEAARPVVAAVLEAYQAERERLLGMLEDERAAWETLLENERRNSRQREKALQERLEQSRKMLQDLAGKLEQIEARVKGAPELEGRLKALEKENAELRAQLAVHAVSGRTSPAGRAQQEGAGGATAEGLPAEEGGGARRAGERPAAFRKSSGRSQGKRRSGGHPGIRLSADDVR